MRPPWSVPETDFTRLCDRCGDCLKACAERIVVRGEADFPTIDFRRGECTFCGDCARACAKGALAWIDGRAPWTLEPRISQACISHQGVTCRVCGDHCEPRALRFRLVVGGAAQPVIDVAACNGCGACVAPCPVHAISLIARNDSKEGARNG